MSTSDALAETLLSEEFPLLEQNEMSQEEAHCASYSSVLRFTLATARRQIRLNAEDEFKSDFTLPGSNESYCLQYPAASFEYWRDTLVKRPYVSTMTLMFNVPDFSCEPLGGGSRDRESGLVQLPELPMVMSVRSFMERMVPLCILVVQIVATAILMTQNGGVSTEWCPGDASLHTKLRGMLVAVIYFVRLAMAALDTHNKIFFRFQSFTHNGHRNSNLCDGTSSVGALYGTLYSVFFSKFICFVGLYVACSSESLLEAVLAVMATDFITRIDTEYKALMLGNGETYVRHIIETHLVGQHLVSKGYGVHGYHGAQTLAFQVQNIGTLILSILPVIVMLLLVVVVPSCL